MNKIYILTSGASIISEAIHNCKFKDEIIMFNPVLHSIILRTLRKIHFKLNFKSKKLWVDSILTKNLIKDEKINTIIIFDAPIWIENISYIRKKYSNIKIVFFFWNIIKDQKKLEIIKQNCDNVITFDKMDAQKYNLNYHPAFCWFRHEENLDKTIDTDLLFIGRNKNRIDILEKIYLQCINKNLKPNFYVVKDTKEQNSIYFDLKEKDLPYMEALKFIYKSKCILDINQSGQVGITFRVLEALFLKKKLITNNKDVINYDFFNENNIFILDDTYEISKEFMKSNFVDIDKSIVDKYTIDGWIQSLTRK